MRYIGSDLDPDPWKKLRIQIRRHDAGPSDPKWTFCKNNLRVLRAYINFSQRTALRQKILRTILYIYLLCTVYCTVDQRETKKKIPWKPKSTPDGFNFGHVPDISGSGGGGGMGLRLGFLRVMTCPRYSVNFYITLHSVMTLTDLLMCRKKLLIFKFSFVSVQCALSGCLCIAGVHFMIPRGLSGDGETKYRTILCRHTMSKTK